MEYYLKSCYQLSSYQLSIQLLRLLHHFLTLFLFFFLLLPCFFHLEHSRCVENQERYSNREEFPFSLNLGPDYQLGAGQFYFVYSRDCATSCCQLGQELVLVVEHDDSAQKVDRFRGVGGYAKADR